MKIVSLYNIKGGIGKTTLTTLMSYKLAKDGKKILLIDLDLQANTTQYFYKTNHSDKTMINAIKDGAKAEELIIKSPNEKYPSIDLIPADIELCVLAEYMATQNNKNKLMAIWFRNNLETLEKYDYIFVDLSPSIDLLNRNMLYICSSIIIPLSHGDLASMRGAELFNKLFAQDMKKFGMEDNTKKAVLLNNNKSYNRKILDLFDKQLQQYTFCREHLLETVISESTTIQQAPIMRTGLGELTSKYKNKKVEKQLENLVEELIEKEIL